MKQIMIIPLIWFLLANILMAKENIIDTKHTQLTRQEIKKQSRIRQENILTAKVLNFDKINEEENLLLGYDLTEEDILFMQKVVNRSIELYGVDSLETQVLYLYLALDYLVKNDIVAAKSIYMLVEENKENMKYENDLDLTYYLIMGKAKFNMLQKKYIKSKEILLNYLYLLETNKLTYDVQYAKILKSLAHVENEIGEYDKAFKYMKQSTKILKVNKLNFSLSETIDTIFNVYDIYINKQDTIGAVASIQVAYKKIAESNETLMPNDSLELWLRTCHIDVRLGAYKEAKKFANKALTIQKKLKLKNTFMSTTLDCLATAERGLHNYHRAKKLYRQALDNYLSFNIYTKEEKQKRILYTETILKELDALIKKEKEGK